MLNNLHTASLSEGRYLRISSCMTRRNWRKIEDSHMTTLLHYIPKNKLFVAPANILWLFYVLVMCWIVMFTKSAKIVKNANKVIPDLEDASLNPYKNALKLLWTECCHLAPVIPFGSRVCPLVSGGVYDQYCSLPLEGYEDVQASLYMELAEALCPGGACMGQMGR